MGNVKPLLTEDEDKASELFARQVDIAQTIGNWFPSKFTQFKGTINDDEDTAITYLKSTLWPPIAAKIKAVDDEMKFLLPNNRKKWDVLNGNIRTLKSLGTAEDANGYTFLTTMRGGSTFGDTWVIELKDPITGSKSRVTIDTDF
jgi:hypothetical protein